VRLASIQLVKCIFEELLLYFVVLRLVNCSCQFEYFWENIVALAQLEHLGRTIQIFEQIGLEKKVLWFLFC
jgi:hypothetical protein